METTQQLTSQQIHTLGITAALNAAASHNDNIFTIQGENYCKYYVNDHGTLREAIFCCSTSTKNGTKINNNVSRREYRNRFIEHGIYDDKCYILVHLDVANNTNKFYKISHRDLCLLQYHVDCVRTNHTQSISEWLCNGSGRNNISCDLLTSCGYEVWN